MKKITSLLIALFAITATYAQNNNLVVFAENGERFTLILNGIRQNAKPETNVKVTSLNAQNYKAKIIFEAKNLNDVDQNVLLMWEGETAKNTEFTYSISKKKDKYKLKFVSQAPINVNASPEANQTVVTYTTVDPGTSINVNLPGTSVNANTTTTTTTTTATAPTTTTTTTGTGTGTGQSMSVGVNVNGVGMNMNVNINDGTSTSTTTSSSTSYSTTTTTTDVHNTTPANNTSYGCVSPMSSSEFSEAKKSISSKSFSDTQLKVAKQIIDANCLSTAQVKEIMEIFAFEETRLDLAKYAYNKTTDPKNYYKLNDAFKFESTIEELDNYIKGQQK